MAFINDNLTCFSPNITLERVESYLQEKSVDDISNGDVIVTADKNFDGLSKVNVSGLYYTADGEPYAKVMRIAKNIGGRYYDCERLEKLVFVNCESGAYDLEGFMYCSNLKELVFDEDCNVSWIDTEVERFGDVETIRVNSLSADAVFVEYAAFIECEKLKRLYVYEGWDRSLTLYANLLLEAECIELLFNMLGFVTEGQYIDLGWENTSKISDAVIDVALSKGWDVY